MKISSAILTAILANTALGATVFQTVYVTHTAPMVTHVVTVGENQPTIEATHVVTVNAEQSTFEDTIVSKPVPVPTTLTTLYRTPTTTYAKVASTGLVIPKENAELWALLIANFYKFFGPHTTAAISSTSVQAIADISTSTQTTISIPIQAPIEDTSTVIPETTTILNFEEVTPQGSSSDSSTTTSSAAASTNATPTQADTPGSLIISTSTHGKAPTATAPSSPQTTTSTIATPATSSTSVSETSGTASADSDDFAAVILKAHNEKRALHGVPALTWDNTLADYAKNYADSTYKCNGDLKHSGGKYGENLSAGYSTTGAVDAWYDEGANYNYNSEDDYDHFTQLIWKSTTKLGCAYIDCGGAWGRYIICEYDPHGNVFSQFQANVLPPI
ncbi:hypothetical protein BABINDRAFT_114500 [Babjeviella inositovora NRRL Y-12698]|uniref:SCP domain-containing protein n=1 Tax=Babjeviella inositovora NRRL Y-12698 TaxID=984486 RepID=A0A1E3QWK9_9ASCO|nr:uncharacterized protein BABINDRAFT_114500 [Babjeviella inositovora NRRL Y-12698]ODQ82030.1 hypothetical protein BABINDRAFT_114500 [Babjeviella inositovora NRRL Y-12698]